MRFFVWPIIRRGLTTATVLAFFLYSLSVAWGAEKLPSFFDAPLIIYGIKISLALLLLWGGGWVLLRWGPSSWRSGVSREEQEGVVLLSSRVVGRGKVYLLRCGPDVIAFWSGRKESILLGRWSGKEWQAWCEEKSSVHSSSE